MTRHLVHWTILALVVLTTTTTVGCTTRWIDVTPAPTNRANPVTQSVLIDERVPLVMDGFRMTQNGAPQNPSTEVERRILNTVHETHLFSTLVPLGGNVVPLGDKVVTARITFDETIDSHSGETAWKGFLIGASMFLLSPVIDLDYDYAAEASLELGRWDGQVKRYTARSAGTAHYTVFAASPTLIGELKGQVTEACLTDLMDQLIRDTNFYVASSAPLPDSPVVSVTVKARKPQSSLASPSAVPVSTAPAP
ncbi:MAG TPA: hypothetical protein VLH80_09840 [Nitrospiraceae bacterium]|jgi:hypothetical protein|nr:hypothetical protein [Nitrospiraceae bacterium]